MRQLIVLGGLLSVALVATYLTWFGEEGVELEAGETIVYQASPKDVAKIAWKSEKVDVELRPSSDDKGDYVMVHITERREKAPPPKPPEAEEDGHDHGDAGAEDHGDEDAAGDEGATDGEEAEEPEEAPEPEIETTVTYFKGNKAADDVVKSLAPLVAMRELKLPPGADPADFGFDEPSATLEVERRSGKVELTIGGETFGSKDRYVQYNGKTYLVDDQVLRPLQYAKTRLMERALQPLSERDIDEVQVTAGERTVTYVHKNPDDRAKSYWALADDPDTEQEEAGTWMGKAFKLRARAYVQPDDLPELDPAFTMVVRGGKEAWTIEVFRAADDDKKFYARSDFLRSTVELTASLAGDAVADLDALFPSGDGEGDSEGGD